MIGTWAKSVGKQGTKDEVLKSQTFNLQFQLAKKLVFSNIKKALGLDHANYLIFGAAPLSKFTRNYFLSLNMFLVSCYGMSESSGPWTFHINIGEYLNLRSVGKKLQGTTMKIFNPGKDGVGEICVKGRNRFMGYFKNEKATMKSIDDQGFLHSGDLGIIENGELLIKGRIKELIITAGGENIAPLLIEDKINKYLPIVSKSMVVGDQKKFISVLLTLQTKVTKDNSPTEYLTDTAISFLRKMGSSAKTVKQAQKCNIIRKYIDEGIKKANVKAVSRAATVRKWIILPLDFSVKGGELTPTLKLKRAFVSKKYQKEIDNIYLSPRL